MASAVHKKQTESKYVTCFADSRPDVDITFRDVLLSRPTDHYLVGIDNFSMTNTSLSMIEPMTGDSSALIRVVQRILPQGNTALQTTADALDAIFIGNPKALNGLYVTSAGYNFEISSQETVLSVQQLMHRLGELASDVCRYMNTGQAGAELEYGGYTQGDNNDTEHLAFEVATDGRLRIIGTAAFWSCFCIEVPAVQNQFGFFGARADAPATDFSNQRRFLALNPEDAATTFAKIQINSTQKSLPGRPVQTGFETDFEFAIRVAAWEVDVAAVVAFNSRTVKGTAPKFHIVATALVGNANRFNINTGAIAHSRYAFTTRASIFSSLERRVALEVGCSLPIKNSPMVDHQKETPDFVLGRWIWRTDPRIESNDKGGSRRYHSAMPACTEYQGAQDRITYHELQPQAKIQTLRIKLFARLRTFDEASESYSMRIVDLPTSSTDWWHTRIHFMSKD